VLGDVGDPQLVHALAAEPSVDEVGGQQVRAGSAPLRGTGGALEVGAGHQQLHGAVTDDEAAPHGEFGMDTSIAVGPSGGQVDLADGLGHQRVPHRR
jgi:hypothetical protein